MTPSLRRVLIEHAAAGSAVALALALVLALAVGTPADAVAAGLAGVVATLDFLAIIWIVSGLLAEDTSAPGKAGLVLLMLAKLAFVGVLLWSLIVRRGFDGLGVPLGIAASIAGFTWGTLRGQASKAGRAAIDAEERRITAQSRAPH